MMDHNSINCKMSNQHKPVSLYHNTCTILAIRWEMVWAAKADFLIIAYYQISIGIGQPMLT